MYKLLLAFAIFGHLAADGLSDLRAALGKYAASSTIRGTLEAQYFGRHGKDKDATETRGQAFAQIEYGPSGLRAQWGRPLLSQLDRETRARLRPNPPTNQAHNALWALEMRKIYSLVNAAEDLSRLLETATFVSEGAEIYNGSQARALNFSVASFGDSQRFSRWLREHNSTLKIWIASDGSPLGHLQKTTMKFRAFIFITLEQTREETVTYANIGDHLVAIRQEESQEFQGGGEYNSSRTLRIFRPS